MEINFLIPGEPRGKGRPRFTRTGHAYTPPRTRKYETEIRNAAREAMGLEPPTKKFCRVEIDAYFAIPKTYNKKQHEQAENCELFPTRIDIDNIVKAVLDGMNNVVYCDDKQIIEIVAAKRFGEYSCVEVKVMF